MKTLDENIATVIVAFVGGIATVTTDLSASTTADTPVVFIAGAVVVGAVTKALLRAFKPGGNSHER